MHLMLDDASRILYEATAPCGAGKTQGLIAALPNLLKDYNVVIASPNNNLALQTVDDIQNAGLEIVNTVKSDTPGRNLISALSIPDNEVGNLVSCSHQVFDNFRGHSKFNNWILVIDEIPLVVKLEGNTFPAESAVELDAEFESNNDGYLKVTRDASSKVEAEVQKYHERSGMSPTKADEVLSVYLAIFSAGKYVTRKPTERGTQYSRCEFNHNLMMCMSRAKEVHILSAGFTGSLFDIVTKHYGFTCRKSQFTPVHRTHKGSVSIVSLLPETDSYTKSFALRLREEKVGTSNAYLPDKAIYNSDFYCDKEQNIDTLLKAAVMEVRVDLLNRKPALFFFNNWFIGHKDSVFLGVNPTVLTIESLGLNQYRSHDRVVCLFSANINPKITAAMKMMADITSTSEVDIAEAYNITYQYEKAYQCVSRCAVRDFDSELDITVVVPDYSFARYIKDKLPCQSTIRQTQYIDKLSRGVNNSKKELVIQAANNQLETKSKINVAKIYRDTNIHRNTVNKYLKEEGLI